MPADWRDYFHTSGEVANAPNVQFIIEGFLEEDGVTALAAPVGQRKSIIALNVAHAVLTGEPLFGHFAVKNKPSRVLYLCPEMGLQSFSQRVREIGLLPFVGKTLFCRTAASTMELALAEIPLDALQGALVIVDTLVRFVEGDEDRSADMRVFAKTVMQLISNGAKSVLLLHHSGKATKSADELTLENVLRGSGEIGAFLAACWGTRLLDPNDEYHSPSYLKNCKQRNFESKPFTAIGGPDYRMRIADLPGKAVLGSARAFRGNKDGRDEAALALIAANAALSSRRLVDLLSVHGIKRGKDWVSQRIPKIRGTGVTTADGSAALSAAT